MPVLTDSAEIRAHVAAVMDGKLPRYLLATDFPEGRDALQRFAAGAAVLAGVPGDSLTYAEIDILETASGQTTHATVLTILKAAVPRPVVAAFLTLAVGHTGGIGPEQDLIMLGRDGLHLAALLDTIRRGKAYPVTVGAN